MQNRQRHDAPGSAAGASIGFESEAEFDRLASAVAALTADDLSGLGDALSTTSSYASEDVRGHIGGGFLANQF